VALALALLAMIGVSLSLYAIAATHPDRVLRHEQPGLRAPSVADARDSGAAGPTEPAR
jgi:hypothetical protein